MSTLAQIRAKVSARFSKVDPNNKVWDLNSIKDKINDAIEQIQSAGSYSWPFNEKSYSGSTVISQAGYDLPSGFVRLKDANLQNVYYNGYGHLIGSTREYLKSIYGVLTATGTPYYFYFYADQINFYYIPNAVATFSFDYLGAVTAMAEEDDESGLPSRFDRAIVDYVEFLCWQEVPSANDKQQRAYENYLLSISERFANDLGRQQESNYQFTYPTL